MSRLVSCTGRKGEERGAGASGAGGSVRGGGGLVLCVGPTMPVVPEVTAVGLLMRLMAHDGLDGRREQRNGKHRRRQ
jgi:hypothetical protein